VRRAEIGDTRVSGDTGTGDDEDAFGGVDCIGDRLEGAVVGGGDGGGGHGCC